MCDKRETRPGPKCGISIRTSKTDLKQQLLGLKVLAPLVFLILSKLHERPYDFPTAMSLPMWLSSRHAPCPRSGCDTALQHLTSAGMLALTRTSAAQMQHQTHMCQTSCKAGASVKMAYTSWPSMDLAGEECAICNDAALCDLVAMDTSAEIGTVHASCQRAPHGLGGRLAVRPDGAEELDRVVPPGLVQPRLVRWVHGSLHHA